VTHEEYEERYLEALDVVRRKLTEKTVRDPEHTPSGTRFVHIDEFPCNDRVVFRMAWGEEVARDIMNEKPQSPRKDPATRRS
jgi:hypothetical protein